MASVGEISDHSDLDEVCDDHYDGSGGYDYSSGDGSPDNVGDNHEDDGSPDNDSDNDDDNLHGSGSYDYSSGDGSPDNNGDNHEDDGSPDNDDDDFHTEPNNRRSKYAPEISPAAIRAIILKELVIQRVNTVDIPEDEGDFTSPENHKNSLRYYEFKGFAWFTCREQHEPDSPDIKIRRWASARSWCFIDLKKQEICYRDTQECKVDNIVAQPGPEFTEEVIQKMAKWVVKGFLLKTGRIQHVPRDSTDTDKTEGGPHDEGRCGKCKRLGRSC
ncbi:uncharacterized protein MAL13P1.304-like isoform X4 [Halichondria panicea]